VKADPGQSVFFYKNYFGPNFSSAESRVFKISDTKTMALLRYRAT
jgi:hypothetical protein